MDNNNLSKKLVPLKHISSEWEYDKEKDKLGEGSFGSVYKAKKLNGLINDEIVNICAIKIIKKENINLIEIDILNTLNHSYGFLKYYGYGIDKDNYYIYMQYIEGAISIREMLDSGYKFSEWEFHVISKKVLGAIDYLHDNHIAHRDIKSDHILLIYSNKFSGLRVDMYLDDIKIIDFGCSISLENNTKYSSYVGTYEYMAPEVKLQNGKASLKSDMWSFGCLLLEMLGGNLSNYNNGIPIIPNTIPLELKQIIQECLVFDPNGRSKAFDIWAQFYDPHKDIEKESIETVLGLLPYNYSGLTVDVIPGRIDYFGLSSHNHSALTVGLIPNGVINLDISSYNHSALTADIIPNSVVYLNLRSYNHSALTVGIIPYNVVELNLSSYNHSALSVGVIPNSVTKLNLSSYNHELSVGVIPNSVVDLNLSSYNHSALEVGVIPNSVKYLYISSYNHSALNVGIIPNSVVDINLSSYNHSALEVGVIPNSVTNLNLSSYNHSELAFDVIPYNVVELKLSSYNHSALSVGVIPNSVTNLNLSSYNHELSVGVIPNNVKQLSFNKFNQYFNYDDIPKSVTSLDLGEEFDLFSNGEGLPNEEALIYFKCSFDFSKRPQKPLNEKEYPRSVIDLSLPNYNLKLKQNSISKFITILELGSNFKHFETLKFIPSSVYQLKFGDPEFNELNKLQYLLKIKPYITDSISHLIINNQDVTEEFYQLKK